MLVLTRLPGEEIVIHAGETEIRVKVMFDDRGRVRLGFTAPPEVKILRAELEESRDIS